MKRLPRIGLIDTSTSNIKSVFYALKEFNCDVVEIKNFKDQTNIDAMVVPGIGSFDFVMKKLKQNKLDHLIYKSIEKGIPSLFICVGMQILFSESYEFGKHKGLNIFKGKVKKIKKLNNKKDTRKIPFIGWNKLIVKKKCKILKNIKNNEFFYFTHSYYAEPKDKKIISTKTNYHDFKYCSSVSSDNIFATQFHPEKSGHSGLKIYKDFVNLVS